MKEEVLSYYPQIVEIFWDNGQKEFMEESLRSFNMIEKIIEIDKRGEKYQARIEEIKRQIENYNVMCCREIDSPTQGQV